MNRYFIELAYKGTAYHGWQIQPNAITVQELLQDAFYKALRREVGITGAGRTDTGVHASYFVAHFEMVIPIDDLIGVMNKVNRILPQDIVVYSLQQVNEYAHSRFDAVARKYEYRVAMGKNPFTDGYVCQSRFKLDYDAMNKACAILFNYKDFTSFSKLHTDVKTNNCTICIAQWEQRHGEWVFVIQADRFLRNMVRAIVGTLFEVGRGKISVDEFENIIKAKDRSLAGASAPAHALYLVDIIYPKEVFNPIYRDAII